MALLASPKVMLSDTRRSAVVMNSAKGEPQKLKIDLEKVEEEKQIAPKESKLITEEPINAQTKV